SGGSIVIDTTEALVAIDVNSSRANKAEDVETTAFKTNLEAAEEVARHLRIRDLGGLVIVDFIDMSFYPNRKQVEEKLMEALQQDRARIQMSRISKLGLVEISRQRLSSSINESVMQKCPRCEGHGFIKTTQATALTILRKIRAEAIKEDTNEIRVQVPVDIAAYILNEKRDSIVEISGGSIVIDTTEALVAIDVNSSRANKAEDVETTAFKTNLEAAEEVARQLRIRDLGGLVIVDFIDMSFYPNRKQVEEKLMEALQQDRARIQMSRISKLGLVEISRQRLSSSINESVMQKCPRCEGHGFIKTTQATALTILRKIRAEAIKEDTNEIRVQVPVDIAAYILNEKRDSIVEI
ncbi:ribonuclease E/G, partial [Francisella tularensis]|uniref:ribonuclease E/G n=1 Tax=Francisella tularensis TaxID=263 RepID=UPI001F3679D6